MILYGFTCPSCGTYHRETDGYRRADGALSIRCPACREIDIVRRHRGTLVEAVE